MTLRLRPLMLAAAAATLLAGPLRGQRGFVVEYAPAQDPTEVRVRGALMSDGTLERLAGGLNLWIRMPRQVPLRMVPCTSSNIRWNAEDHAVEMCYRMTMRLFGITEGQDSLKFAFLGGQTYLRLHGIAHGIIEELHLATGPDVEDAVDELTALLILAAHDPDASVQLLNGVATLRRADETWEEWPYATAHGLERARFENVACLVYGSNPEIYGGVRQAGLLAAGSEPRCRTAGRRVLDVWGRRLASYLS